MNTKKILFFLLFTCLSVAFLKTQSQTTGTLNFSVLMTEPSGGFNNKLVLAIWLEDSATGNFIKTKMRYAVARVQYLNTWIAKSGQNVVDATTGATTSPGTFSIIWNGTDVSGNVVPDGNYKVWIQYSDQNVNGPTKYCTFTKGPTAISGKTFPNSGNCTNMVLSWTPTSTSINKIVSENNPLQVYPNPSHDKVTVNFHLKKDNYVTVVVFNAKGQIVEYLLKNKLADIGVNTVVWNNSQSFKAPKGIYFIKVMCSEYEKVTKVVIL